MLDHLVQHFHTNIFVLLSASFIFLSRTFPQCSRFRPVPSLFQRNIWSNSNYLLKNLGKPLTLMLTRQSVSKVSNFSSIIKYFLPALRRPESTSCLVSMLRKQSTDHSNKVSAKFEIASRLADQLAIGLDTTKGALGWTLLVVHPLYCQIEK